jgi:hypothetical protein
MTWGGYGVVTAWLQCRNLSMAMRRAGVGSRPYYSGYNRGVYGSKFTNKCQNTLDFVTIMINLNMVEHLEWVCLIDSPS